MSAGANFALAIERFATGTKRQIDAKVRGITIELFRSIILATPVDTGRARGNWQCSVGSPAQGVLDSTSAQAALSQVAASAAGAGSLCFLSNNLPYIEKLEFGGYPDGPNTSGGFSRQAPAGMVRINLARIEQIVRTASKP